MNHKPYVYSPHSIAQRATVHPILQSTCDAVIEIHDFRIEVGARVFADQVKAFRAGFSKDSPDDGEWPHKDRPDGCRAVDVHPIVDGKKLDPALFGRDVWETAAWAYFAGIFTSELQRQCRWFSARTGSAWTELWGGNWSRDARILDKADRRFIDAYHWEIRAGQR